MLSITLMFVNVYSLLMNYTPQNDTPSSLRFTTPISDHMAIPSERNYRFEQR